MDKTPDELNAEITRLQELLNGAQARGRETKEDADRKGEAEGAQATAAEQGTTASSARRGRGRRTAGQDKPTEDAGIYQAGEGVQAGEPRAADAGSDAAPEGRQTDGRESSGRGLAAEQAEVVDDSTRPRGPDAAALPIDGETTERGESEAIQLGETTVAHTQQSAVRNIVETGSRGIAHAQARMQTATDLCVRICEGESLNALCKEPDMPTIGTFLRWCAEDAEVGQMYVAALRIRAAWHAEQLLEDMDKLDHATENHEVAALKVKINTRQWIMSRLLPKQYGEKIEHEHTGEVKLDEKQIDDRLKHLVGRIQGLQPKA